MVVRPPRTFPFRPPTTTSLEPGDFWAIPLRRGGWFACGRVLDLVPRSRTSVVVGLMDWCEPVAPSVDNLAGSRVVSMATVHIKCIWLTGELILGSRPLDLDGGVAELIRFAPGAANPGGWGYLEIEDRAHNHFGRHFPFTEGVYPHRPPGLDT